jgi:hypothetical protein
MSYGRAETGNDLDGFWHVERTGGLLPPLYGIRKQITGGRGWTRLGPIPLFPFDVVGFELHYRPPLTSLVDVLQPAAADAYSGFTTIAGKQVGTFSMFRPPAERLGA